MKRNIVNGATFFGVTLSLSGFALIIGKSNWKFWVMISGATLFFFLTIYEIMWGAKNE